MEEVGGGGPGGTLTSAQPIRGRLAEGCGESPEPRRCHAHPQRRHAAGQGLPQGRLRAGRQAGRGHHGKRAGWCPLAGGDQKPRCPHAQGPHGGLGPRPGVESGWQAFPLPRLGGRPRVWASDLRGWVVWTRLVCEGVPGPGTAHSGGCWANGGAGPRGMAARGDVDSGAKPTHHHPSTAMHPCPRGILLLKSHSPCPAAWGLPTAGDGPQAIATQEP